MIVVSDTMLGRLVVEVAITKGTPTQVVPFPRMPNVNLTDYMKKPSLKDGMQFLQVPLLVVEEFINKSLDRVRLIKTQSSNCSPSNPIVRPKSTLAFINKPNHIILKVLFGPGESLPDVRITRNPNFIYKMSLNIVLGFGELAQSLGT
ncbi:hypothetical protein HAX54_015199 [Datura stramonium]|uniref:Uncharacterized protein n=1 Tax=Datura stramonium TaxID=4076 RepID=A0ABS8Y2J5_DATST|nr:hypothetical protein [Datura stramonium]